MDAGRGVRERWRGEEKGSDLATSQWEQGCDSGRPCLLTDGRKGESHDMFSFLEKFTPGAHPLMLVAAGTCSCLFGGP